MSRPDLEAYLGDLLSSGAVTAAAAVIGQSGAVAFEVSAGRKRRSASSRTGGSGRVTTSSLFDLASLTKPVTATLALVLDAGGELPLRRTISRALAGEESSPGLGRKSLGSLLRHRSGFKPWDPLFARGVNAEEVIRTLASDPALHGADPSTYSDLGYIVWAGLAERTTGESLGSLVRSRVAKPLGLENHLLAAPVRPSAAVECPLGNEREQELAAALGITIPRRRAPQVGTVQDGNARFLGLDGGVSGHAGLFGSARAVWRLAAEWAQPSGALDAAAVASALRGRGRYALGWRRNPPETHSRDGLWYGHLGFTGGGVWFCPETTEVRVLLAHRSGISVDLEDWRTRFLEVVAE